MSRAPWDWLEPGSRNLRSALRDVEAALRRGFLDGPGPVAQAHREALIDALMRLIDDPTTPSRAVIRAGRILGIAGGGDRIDRPTRLERTD